MFTLHAPRAHDPARLECSVCYRVVEPALIVEPRVFTVGFGETGAVTERSDVFCVVCVEREALAAGDPMSPARRDQLAQVYEDLEFENRLSRC